LSLLDESAVLSLWKKACTIMEKLKNSCTVTFYVVELSKAGQSANKQSNIMAGWILIL
jgi:hypothetical protein